MFVEFAPVFTGSAELPTVNPGLFSFNDAAGSGFRGRGSRLTVNTTASIRWGSRVSSTTNEIAGAMHNDFLVSGQNYRVGFSYGDAFLAGSVNSTINEISDSNYSSLPAATQMLIGAQSIGGTPTALNGHIRRLTYFLKRLSNTTLQTITQV
jgi:hypothetical protein